MNAPASSSEGSTSAPGIEPAASPVARAFAVVGLVWQSALLYGLASCVFLAVSTFLKVSRSGSSDPQIMAEGIGQALVPLLVYASIGVFGLLVTLITAVASRYRAKWFLRTSALFAALYLFFPPVGTVISIVLIVFLVAKRKEFTTSMAAQNVA